MHKHAFASYVLILLRVPTESHLHRAVHQIISFNCDPLIHFPLIQAPLVTAQHKLSDESFLIFNPLKLLKLYPMR
jgi:hypothetical protein